MSAAKPTIVVTMGDPAGIGPEVVVKALADSEIVGLADWIVAGDYGIFQWAEALTGLRLPPAAKVDDPRQIEPSRFVVGQLSPECGRAALAYIRRAVELCLGGQAQAMVTAPVNKEAATLAGEKFTGHTEFIAELCGGADSRMLLVNDFLRVVHVTTHVPLRSACELDAERIRRTIDLAQEAGQLLGLENPRIAVCGLNPHAGEHGLFGGEDSTFIAPAVEAARKQGVLCDGPAPADTIFLEAARGGYDVVVAMYHDQGHIPAKLLDFEHTVNVSLGLPIIRTSVDHGTAFDIAGKNLADPGSMKAALKLAALMVRESLRRKSKQT